MKLVSAPVGHDQLQSVQIHTDGEHHRTVEGKTSTTGNNEAAQLPSEGSLKPGVGNRLLSFIIQLLGVELPHGSTGHHRVYDGIMDHKDSCNIGLMG